MEITKEEYLSLMKRIDELERERSVNKMLTYKCWAYAVNELPIESIRIVSDHSPEPVLRYDSCARDAWGLFTKLAKEIHKSTYTYKAEIISWSKELYWRGCGRSSAPTRYGDLTDTQKQLSLEMLNELIPIYNKYFKIAHPGTWVTDLDGVKRFVEVAE